MARKAIAVEMPTFEYTGRVNESLVTAAKSNSNLSDMVHYGFPNHPDFFEKDFRATIDYLHAEGCDTAAFFLHDEMKRFF